MVSLHIPARAISVAIAVALLAQASTLANDYAVNLRCLASKNDSEARKAAEWFATYPFDPAKQAEVSRALNALDRDKVRAAAGPALAVWGTKENIPLIANLFADRIERAVALDMAEKYPDPRLIEPLIGVLTSPFDDGNRAEKILAGWSADADAALIKRLNDPNGETHVRIARIVGERKLDSNLLARQSVADLGSQNEDQRRYAAEWLSKADSVPRELHSSLTAAAFKLLDEPKTASRLAANEMLKRYAHKDHDAALLKLLDDKEALRWQAGLKGLIHTGNVACAKTLAQRMKDGNFLNQACGIMTGAGPAAEELALAILREPQEGDGQIQLTVAVVVGNIGGRKSLPALQQFAEKNSRGPKAKLVASSADSAARKISARLKSKK